MTSGNVVFRSWQLPKGVSRIWGFVAKIYPHTRCDFVLFHSFGRHIAFGHWSLGPQQPPKCQQCIREVTPPAWLPFRPYGEDLWQLKRRFCQWRCGSSVLLGEEHNTKGWLLEPSTGARARSAPAKRCPKTHHCATLTNAPNFTGFLQWFGSRGVGGPRHCAHVAFSLFCASTLEWYKKCLQTAVGSVFRIGNSIRVFRRFFRQNTGTTDAPYCTNKGSTGTFLERGMFSKKDALLRRSPPRCTGAEDSAPGAQDVASCRGRNGLS